MKKTPIWVAMTAGLAGLCGVARAAPGDLDYSFGTAGRLTHMGTVVPLRDGRLAIISYSGAPELVMYRADGRIDTAYGDGGTARYPVATAAGFTAWAGAATTDHSVFLLGNRAAVLKLNAAGTVATEFGSAGSGTTVIDSTAGGAGITVDARGRPLVLITQPCSDPNCRGPLRLVRLRPDGSVDTSFGSGGRTELTGIQGGDLQPSLLAARTDGGAVVVDCYGRALALTETGQPDPQFGTAGLLRPTAGFPAYLLRASLLSRDRLLLAGLVQPNDPTRARLTLLTRSGERDTEFAGDGTLDLAELDIAAIANAAPGQPFQFIDVAASPDSSTIYVLLGFGLYDSAPFNCTGILALTSTGIVRRDFGSNGFSCISKDFPYYASLISEANGALLFSRVDYFNDESIEERISTGASGGQGVIGFRLRSAAVDENAGRIDVAVSRLAGRDGAASIRYQVVGQTAQDGSDFIAEVGSLTWPDGDASDRQITVRLINDNLAEPSEVLSVALLQGSPSTGGRFELTILDSDTAPPGNAAPPPASNPASPSISSPSGGGGRADAALLGILLALLWARKARSSNRPRACEAVHRTGAH